MIFIRTLISFVSALIVLGGGILGTILLVTKLDAPALVFPGIIATVAAVLATGWITVPGRTTAEKLRRVSGESSS
jgi:hypothetical protein